METKKCSLCKNDFPKTSEFFAKKGKYNFQSACRECQRKYRKEHYHNNKEKYIKKAISYTKTFVEWFMNLKKGLACEICGENRYWVLEFHHINPDDKSLEVSTLVRKGNRKKILEEIKKCKVLCSNCHKDLHYRQKAGDA